MRFSGPRRGYKVIRAQMQIPGTPGGYGAEDPDDPAYRRAQAARLPYEGIWEPEPYLRIVPKLFDHLRRTVGWDVQLFHDAHGRLTPPRRPAAPGNSSRTSSCSSKTPSARSTPPAMRHVRDAGTTPIGIGEIVSSKYEILPMVVEQTIDYMRCSPMHIGGITEGKKLAAIGRAVRRPHRVPRTGGRVADRRGGQRARGHGHPEFWDSGVGTASRRRPRGVDGGAWLEDGYLRLPDTPGLGVDIDEALAARYPHQRKYLPAPRREDGSMHGY